jgi:hypothetical protein
MSAHMHYKHKGVKPQLPPPQPKEPQEQESLYDILSTKLNDAKDPQEKKQIQRMMANLKDEAKPGRPQIKPKGAFTQAPSNPMENPIEFPREKPKPEPERPKPFTTLTPPWDKKDKEMVIKSLKSANPAGPNGIEFTQQKMASLTFQGGSWAILWRGDIPVGIIPFIAQQDKETRQSWAIFLEQQFYQKKIATMQFKYPVLFTSFDKSPKWASYYGKGYLASFDIVSGLQVPLKIVESADEKKERLADNIFKSQDLSLYRELISHIKAKWNWKLILILVLVAVVMIIVIWYILTHPHWLSGLTSMFGVH